MIERLRRMFAHRAADPDLRRASILHAARLERVPDVTAKADKVAKLVTDARRAELLAGFRRAGERLGR